MRNCQYSRQLEYCTLKWGRSGERGRESAQVLRVFGREIIVGGNANSPILWAEAASGMHVLLGEASEKQP